MFGVKTVALLILGLIVLSGAIYDLTTTGGQCAIGTYSPETGYTCDPLWMTLGATFVFPDDNLWKGTEGMLSLQAKTPAERAEMGIDAEIQESHSRNMIYLGFAGLIFLFAFLSYVFYKITPSSIIDASAKMMPLVTALAIMGLLMAMYDDKPEPGFMELPGTDGKTPFKGLRHFLANPDVLKGVVDDTSVLPGILTTDDILDNSTS